MFALLDLKMKLSIFNLDKNQVTKNVLLSIHFDLFISRKLWAEGGREGVL